MLAAVLIALAVAGLAAAALVLTPRPLFAQVGAAPPPRRLELVLGLGLAAIGMAVALAGPGADPLAKAVLAVALMALAAVIYADLRFLIIPDVYSLVLAVLALVGPLSPGLGPALLGAALCGGVLAIVAWMFRKSSEVGGMGLGDVKLAAAIGGLLGAEHGLWAIAGSAIAAALIAVAFQRLRKEEGRLFIPYGAALALAAGAMLIAGRL
jgi:leader peptidase (prepilin peptidase) / N-methyltransferase